MEQEELQKITIKAVRCLENTIKLYEEFIVGSTHSDMQQRPLEIVKKIYFGGSSVMDMAAEWNMSKETVYADIKKMTRRFAELLEIVAPDR